MFSKVDLLLSVKDDAIDHCSIISHNQFMLFTTVILISLRSNPFIFAFMLHQNVQLVLLALLYCSFNPEIPPWLMHTCLVFFPILFLTEFDLGVRIISMRKSGCVFLTSLNKTSEAVLVVEAAHRPNLRIKIGFPHSKYSFIKRTVLALICTPNINNVRHILVMDCVILYKFPF